MKIFIVTGMPGSGKEELLTVAREMDMPFLRMGDIVREHYADYRSEKGLTIGEFADKARKKKGKDIWAKKALEKMTGGIFLVDGCRSMEEVDAFRTLSEDVYIIAIHSSPDTRYGRLVKRGREDAPREWVEFADRDTREISWGQAEVIALADIMFINESTLEDFHADVRKTLKELRA
ncbi:MAG: AAA family ATPase [Candidatus Methanomethylophilaceae archaeon]|jgi:dephospho-CoA kinase|nr:AAA family ATPase [Candidatus Methanomethylophilaceae archaeon]